MHAYIANDGNRTRAAMEAGYSKDSYAGAAVRGSRLVKMSKIQREIVKVREERLKALGITFDTNALMLKRLADECMSGTRINDKGFIHPVGVYQSIDMLNKMGGFYAAEKVDVNQTENIDFDLLSKLEKDI